jgi:xylono-1,5-lactonase
VLGDVGFEVSNGPAFSPDGHTMYFNDSVGRRTLAYDIRPDDLHPTNRRIIRTYAKKEEGIPDGAIVDQDGMIWIAHWGGAQVSRITPDGQVLARHPVPARNVTTMCFAGPDFRTLYITTARDGMEEAALKVQPDAGSVFRLETDVRGLPEPLFKIG